MANPVSSFEDPRFPNASRFPNARGESGLTYLRLISVALTVVALYFGRPVLLPLAVAVLLAFALAPLVALLRRIHIGRSLSVIVASVVALAVIGGFIAFVGSQVVGLAADFPRYQANLTQKIQSIRGMTSGDGLIQRATTALQDLRDQISGPKEGQSVRQARPSAPPPQPVPVELRQPETPPWTLYTDIITSLLGPLGAAGLIAIFVVFILLYKEDLRDRFIRLVGSRDIQRAKLLLDESGGRLSDYLLSQSAINACFGAFVGTSLWLIGMPNPALWGLSATVFRFVPYFGIPIASLLPIVVALAIDPGWTMVLWTLAIFFGGEFLVGQAIEPWLLGRNVGLSPVAVVVAATFWAWIWGPLGLLLATPLTTCLMVIGRHIEQLNFLEVLLGDKPPLEANEALYLRLLGGDADEAAAEAEEYLKEHSLVQYYEEVAVGALGLAQTDVTRGALTRDQAAEIRDTTQSLIDLLSDHVLPAVSKDKSKEKPILPVSLGEVFCYAGRGPLDEAAALLLIDLLKDKGIGSELVSSNQLMTESPRDDAYERLKTICICFLDPGNFVRARHLMERVRRRYPGKAIIGAFWRLSATDARFAENAKAMGATLVTRLEDGVHEIELKRNATAPQQHDKCASGDSASPVSRFSVEPPVVA